MSPTATTAPTGARWGLRVTTSLLAAILVAQGVTAGDYLSTDSGDALDLHGAGAVAVHVVSGLQTIAAVLLWRASRGPWWPMVLSAVVFAVSFGQAALGGGDSLHLHVPIAMVLLLLVAWVLVWSWSRQPGEWRR